MKKEYWLLMGSTLLSLTLGLLLIRWLAPQLLGLPRDSQLVSLSTELPAFFETVFHNPAERESKDFLINDPVTLVRARPLEMENGELGPHDVLGFRNYSVPTVAPIIVIGDSQTYGINATIDSNWPSEMARNMGLPSTALYNMATGGWSAVQYLNMFTLTPRFQPRAIIVAYYTGNDALESFKHAYGIDKWHFLRPDPSLSLADLPNITIPIPKSETWNVQFQDGSTMGFTPRFRYYANDPASASVKAGYAIMEKTAHLMDEAVKGNRVRLIFTIVPTKELVYAKRIEQEGISPPQDYKNLVEAETHHIQALEEQLKKLANAQYVNIVEPLQQAALRSQGLYPEHLDGHPLPPGYTIIGGTMAKALNDLPKPPQGIVSVMEPDKKSSRLYLLNQEGAWRVTSPSILEQNGWKLDAARQIEARDLAFYPWKGVLQEVNPKRFGPLTTLR